MEAYSITGVAKALLAFYKTARRQGSAEVSFATFNRGAGSNAFIDAIRALDFPIHVIPERSALDRSAYAVLRDLIAHEQPDIVETHAVKSHVLLRLMNRRQTRWVAFHHGYTAPDLKMRLYNRLNPWALRGADQVITVCQAFAQVLAREGVPSQRIAVVGNAIEPFALPTAHPGPTPTVLAIGRLSAEKGHRYLVAAADLLRRARPDLAFEIQLVGDGPERGRLEQQVLALGLGERVHFAGQQADPLPYYAAAQIFVLPSLTEGSPLALLEAMMAGIPVIASRVGGIPETVTDEERALLVPAADAAALAQALKRLLTDAELAARLRADASQAVNSRHTPEAYSLALLAIYRQLLTSSK